MCDKRLRVQKQRKVKSTSRNKREIDHSNRRWSGRPAADVNEYKTKQTDVLLTTDIITFAKHCESY